MDIKKLNNNYAGEHQLCRDAKVTVMIQKPKINELQIQVCDLTLEIFFASTPSLSCRRSLQLSDSKKLDDGTNSTWDKFVHKISAKLSVNIDMSENKDVKLGYLLLSLCEKAAGYITARLPYKSFINLYFDADNLIEDLQAIFEDHDKIKNYDCIHFNLVIRVYKFIDFIIDSRHYSSILNLD